MTLKPSSLDLQHAVPSIQVRALNLKMGERQGRMPIGSAAPCQRQEHGSEFSRVVFCSILQLPQHPALPPAPPKKFQASNVWSETLLEGVFRALFWCPGGSGDVFGGFGGPRLLPGPLFYGCWSHFKSLLGYIFASKSCFHTICSMCFLNGSCLLLLERIWPIWLFFSLSESAQTSQNRQF